MNYQAAIVFHLFLLLFSLNTKAQTFVSDSLPTPKIITDSLSSISDSTSANDSISQIILLDTTELAIEPIEKEINTTQVDTVIFTDSTEASYTTTNDSSFKTTDSSPAELIVEPIVTVIDSIPTLKDIDSSRTVTNTDSSTINITTADSSFKTDTLAIIAKKTDSTTTPTKVETPTNDNYAASLIDSVMLAAEQELAVMQKTKPVVTQTSKEDIKSLDDIPSQIAFVVHCYDSVTKTPLEATVLMSTIDKQGKRSNGTGTCNGKGYFNFSLTAHAHFEITVSFPDYVPYVEEVNFSEHPSFSPVIKKEYPLKRFKVGDVIHLENVNFKQGDFHLQREAFPVLDNLAKLMEQNDHMVIKLKGHTDNSGSGEANLKLSQARVNEVRYYLLRKGIKLNRIKGEGYGGNHPLVPNTCPENMMKNRRVEFGVLKI